MTSFVDESRKLIFVHIPKTGGMSFTKAFLDNNRDHRKNEMSAVNAELGIHAPALKIKRLLGDRFWEFGTLAFIRNPWELQVSFYEYIARTAHHPDHEQVKRMTFERYVTEYMVKTRNPQQLEMISDRKRRIVDELVYTKDLPEKMPELLERYDAPRRTVLRENASNRSDCRGYYSARTREVVQQVFASDIDYFGFTF